MARYRYAGPQPGVDDGGELVHPGDVREFEEAPDCPPWQLAEEAGPPPSPPPVAPPATPAADDKPEGSM